MPLVSSGCPGSHVAFEYEIRYKAPGGTEQIERVDNDADMALPRVRTLNNLMANTAYNFTIQIDGHDTGDYEVFSDISQPEIGITSELSF